MANNTCEAVIIGEYNRTSDLIQWQMLTRLTLTNGEEVIVFFFALKTQLPEDYVISEPRKIIVYLQLINLDHTVSSTTRAARG